MEDLIVLVLCYIVAVGVLAAPKCKQRRKLAKYTIRELKELAKVAKVKKYSRLTKAELIETLSLPQYSNA
jgi:cytochrome c556